MSMAFTIMMIWLALTGLAGFVPADWRGKAMLALMVAGPVIALFALISGGIVPAILAMGIVLTVYPHPLSRLARLMFAALRKATEGLRLPGTTA
jgi:hypothetical protein